MAGKKKINEQTVTPQVNEDGSPAQATLHPGSQYSDPPNRTGMLAAAIGAMHTMTDTDLTKWFTQMIDASKNQSRGVPDGAAEKNKASVNTGVKEAIKQDVATLLAGQEGLSEEFKASATTLFEAAVEARVQGELVGINEKATAHITEQVSEITAELVHQFDVYTDYIVKEWFEENKVAIDSALRTEMTEGFIMGLKNLFKEHFIDVPEDKVDVVAEMATKIEDLEDRLNGAMDENVNLQQYVVASQKKEVLDSLSEGLTLVESTKLRELAENIEVEDIEAFKAKATIIKESQFVKAPKKVALTESLEEANEDNAEEVKPTYSSPNMKNYVEAISRTIVR